MRRTDITGETIMARKFRKIGVLTSGGDAPGMNSALRAVALEALSSGVEVLGIMKGYTGLISGELMELTPERVAGISPLSGTILYSDRCLEFATEEGMKKAVRTCELNQIDGIVAIGGDGTFRGATDLTHHGVPCIGIPGTIDNDITSTDYTIGFDTAMNTVVGLADNLRDTCESHARCSVIEVMGRDAGYIAVESAIAAGAVAVAIPEVPFDEDKAVERIIKERKNGTRAFIVMVSEGLGSEFGEKLTKRINDEAKVESRFARLAHVVRGGKPTLRDRLTASMMGEKAVKELLSGKSDLVICEKDSRIVARDIDYALVLDRLYKNKLKDGDLEKFSEKVVVKMKKEAEEVRLLVKDLYTTANRLA